MKLKTFGFVSCFVLEISCFAFLLFAPHVVAQGFVPLAPIPGLTEGATADTAGLATFFNNLYKYLIGLAAILAVIMIIWGGLEISTQDSISKQGAGREKIKNAIFGLVLVLSPVLVFSIINPSILNLSLNLPPIDLTVKSTTPGGLSDCPSCGLSIHVVYWAPATGMGIGTFDPSTGKVIPRDAPDQNSFISACTLGTTMTVGGGVAIPTDSGMTESFTGGRAGVAYEVTLACPSKTNGDTQKNSGCSTTTGTAGILQIATCPSLAAANTWGEGCRGIVSANPLDKTSSIYIATCQGEQAYVFVNTSSMLLPKTISDLQPVAQTMTNSNNGNFAMLFTKTCQDANIGYLTCAVGVSTLSDEVNCSEKNPKINGLTCYQKTLVCGNFSSVRFSCTSKPNWHIVPN